MDDRELREERARLVERNKELACLYEIAKILADTQMAFPDMLQSILTVLPPAFQHPDKTGARLSVGDLTFATPGFAESPHKIREALMAQDKRLGTMEVVYRPATAVHDPFLPEERKLLRTIARQSAMMIEKKLASDKQAELEGQLRHADRLAKIGQLTAGVAHELNEPLASILGFAQLAVKKIDAPEVAAGYLDRIIQACLHAREIIRKMMMFSSPMPDRKENVELNRLIADGMSFIEPRFAQSGIRFESIFDPHTPAIIANAAQITQVLVNLVINAIHAMPTGGTLSIETAAAEGKARVIVRDTGIGMDAQTIEQIFLPFFTTKDVDQGTGLGLSVVHGIVAAHRGTIEVHSQKGQGTTFTITFPASDEEGNNGHSETRE